MPDLVENSEDRFNSEEVGMILCGLYFTSTYPLDSLYEVAVLALSMISFSFLPLHA